MYIPLDNLMSLLTTISLVLRRQPNIDPVEISQQLIAFPSISTEGNHCIEYLREVLRSLGFTCYILEFEEPDEEDAGKMKIIKNLYARRGNSSPNLCFAGHIDVVPPGNVSTWAYNPFEAKVTEDGILYGRGAVDMKSSVGAFVAAVSRVINSKRIVNGSLSFIITDKEEAINETNGIEATLDWLKARGEKLDFCIVGEPSSETELGDMIKIGRRGILSFRIECTGKQGHVAYPEQADNPIEKMIKILYEIQNIVLDNGTEHFQPSNCEIVSVDVGNKAYNVIPARISSRLNVRYNTLHTAESLIDVFERVCRQVTDKCVVTDVSKEGEPFLTEVTENAILMSNVVRELTGVKPRWSTTGGTSDARFIKKLTDVIEFGLVSKTAHHVDENTAVKDIYKLTDIYQEFINRFFNA